MSISIPTWLWVIIVIALVILVGNVLHLWTIHFSFGV